MILAIVLVGVLFVLLGALIVAKPSSYVKLVKWKFKVLWAGEFKATKATESRMRVLGILFLLLGIIVLCAHLMLGYE
jgi:multisubunit Na+/H+ antiporter MnhG subunit